MTFIDDILREAEEKELQERLEMSHLRADQILMALSVLSKKKQEVEKLCEEEIQLIEQYRDTELSKLQKQESWLCFNLENYLRQTGEKTMRLVHGIIKLRNGRDKIEVSDLEQFLPFAKRKGLLKTIPEEQVPDLQAVHAYIKRWGEIPSGIQVITGETKFSYQLTTNGEKNDNIEQQTESGSAA
jgi:phage host-nuclease inhibitor protein Gam